MPFFNGLGSARATIIGFAVLAAVITVAYVGSEDLNEARILIAASWDKGEGRPAALTLVRKREPSTIKVSKTMSITQINSDWCYCTSSRGGQAAIRRYPTVYNLNSMYGGASVTGGIPSDGCLTRRVKNAVSKLKVASTTSGFTLTYSPDGRTFTFCHPHSERLMKGDSVVIWSEESPYGFPP